MKRLVFPATLLLATAVVGALSISCSNDTEEIMACEEKQMAEVNVTLSALDISIVPDAQLRASDKTASEASINRIAFAIFDAADNSLVYSVTQTSGELGFGNIATKLPLGNYTFVAVAQTLVSNDASTTDIVSPTEVSLCSQGVGVVYSATQSVSIADYNPQNVNIDMGRRKNAYFRVHVTDPTPDNVESIQIIVSPSQNRPASYTINPSSGLALGNWRYERTYSKSELGITTLTDKKFSCGVFLAEDGPQQIDVIVNMLDSEGNILYTTSGTGISIERAQVLEATGPLFSLSTQSSLSFDTFTDLIQITLQ